MKREVVKKKRYAVRYKYVVHGYVEVEANSRKEAIENLMDADGYGECEQTHGGNSIVKVNVIK